MFVWGRASERGAVLDDEDNDSGTRWEVETVPLRLEDPAGRILPTRASRLLMEMVDLPDFAPKGCLPSGGTPTCLALEGFTKFVLITFTADEVAGFFLAPAKQRWGTVLGNIVLNFLSNLFVGPNMGVYTRYEGLYFACGGPSTIPNIGS